MSSLEIEEAQLREILRKVESVRRSSWRSIPVAILGLVATLIAAGVAIWYIVTLSDRLKDTQRQLAFTQLRLSEAQNALTQAGTALRSVRGVQSGEQKEDLKTAILEIETSKSELRKASGLVKQAVASLPESSSTAGPTLDPATVLAALRFSRGKDTGEVVEGYPVYRVSVNLDLPQEVLSEIRVVRYYFNHPSYVSPKVGRNSKTGFGIYWNAWGCISDTSLTVELKNKEAIRAKYDLCDLFSRGRLS